MPPCDSVLIVCFQSKHRTLTERKYFTCSRFFLTWSPEDTTHQHEFCEFLIYLLILFFFAWVEIEKVRENVISRIALCDANDKYALSAQRPSAPTIHHVLMQGRGGGGVLHDNDAGRFDLQSRSA